MDDRRARFCPLCGKPVETRRRRVALAPDRDRPDSYLWCGGCRWAFRVQGVRVFPTVVSWKEGGPA